MAKEKLFTPEDFDKPKDKSFWQKYKTWILGGATLIMAAVVLCCIFYGKDEQKGGKAIEQEHTAQITEKTEAQVVDAESEGVETLTTEEPQKVENEESETIPASVAEIPKSEVKQEVAAQPANVSNNVEQEAMNVIRGDYGNVPERREKLGNKYQEIQNRVNQLKKEGVF